MAGDIFPGILPDEADRAAFDGTDTALNRELAASIESGECPWCTDYTGDSVPQHASSAHAEAWRAYRDEVSE